jgi:hypothetical protein
MDTRPASSDCPARWSPALLLCLAMLSLWAAACAAGPNAQLGTVNDQGIVAGFWRGLWHGLIAPVTFVLSLFSRGVRIYEVHNAGGWYDLGFLLGVSAALGGAARGGRKSASRVRRVNETAGSQS